MRRHQQRRPEQGRQTAPCLLSRGHQARGRHRRWQRGALVPRPRMEGDHRHTSRRLEDAAKIDGVRLVTYDYTGVEDGRSSGRALEGCLCTGGCDRDDCASAAVNGELNRYDEGFFHEHARGQGAAEVGCRPFCCQDWLDCGRVQARYLPARDPHYVVAITGFTHKYCLTCTRSRKRTRRCATRAPMSSALFSARA